MKHLILMVGPPGSGKTTYAKSFDYYYINQDSQGKGHLDLFHTAIAAGKNIIVDRMGFSKEQRQRYLGPAEVNGYRTTIVVLHESYDTCLARCLQRTGHETIKNEIDAKAALQYFFTTYEPVRDTEAGLVERVWPKGLKPDAIICDLDGTLCDVEHRRGYVRRPKGEKKDWPGFFAAMSDDKIIQPIADIIKSFYAKYKTRIVLCSGRPEDYRPLTMKWLQKHQMLYHELYMRRTRDSRQDNIVKEIILDFEILTRYTPVFILDDRDQVVEMWRNRGLLCLQVAPGDF